MLFLLFFWGGEGVQVFVKDDLFDFLPYQLRTGSGFVSGYGVRPFFVLPSKPGFRSLRKKVADLPPKNTCRNKAPPHFGETKGSKYLVSQGLGLSFRAKSMQGQIYTTLPKELSEMGPSTPGDPYQSEGGHRRWVLAASPWSVSWGPEINGRKSMG